ncbi:hypothetical protein V2G26_009368 [Clonostachys chloroleuca]
MNRLDLVGSVALDTVPRFSAPKELTTADKSADNAPPALRSLVFYMKLAFPQLSPISEALCMMSSVARKVNTNSHNSDFWSDGVGAMDLLGPVMHHLLSACRIYSVGSDVSGIQVLGEVVRLVCLMLLSRLKCLFSLNTLDMTPLRTRFMTQLSLFNINRDAAYLHGLKLWALVTSVLIQPSDGMEELLPYIEAVMRCEGSMDIRGAIDLTKALLWIDVIEGQGEALLARKMGVAECKLCTRCVA